MPRSKARAGATQLNRIHRLVAKNLERSLKLSLKGKGETPAALLGKAIEFLRLTDVRTADRDVPRKGSSDPLRDAMPDFDMLEARLATSAEQSS